MTIDVEELRAYLLDYCGSAMIHLSHEESAVGHISPWHPYSHMQGMGVIGMGLTSDIEHASPEELIEIANYLGVI